MAQQINFSSQLPNSPDPVSPNGGLLVQAGAEQGQAAVAGARGISDLLKEGTGMAVQAVEGYLASGQSADIKKIQDQLNTSNQFRNNVDILNNPASAPEDLQKAQQDLANSKAALDQGLITREQALLQIDKKVKDYSNILPGYAADLRKMAATMTGIPHMGYYQEYANLNKQSMSEKVAEQRALAAQKAQEHLTTLFINDWKRLPTPADLQNYALQGQLEQRAKQLKLETEIRGATVAQTEPAIQDLVSTRLGQGILHLSTMISGLAGAKDEKGNILPPENLAVARQNILARTNQFFAGLQAEVNSFNSNQLSPGTKETILNRLNTQQKDLVTSLSNSDSFDAFKKIMDLNKAKTENIYSNWALANNQSYIISRTGVALPPILERYLDTRQNPTRAAQFDKLYPGMTNYYNSILGDSSGGVARTTAENSVKIAQDPPHLDAIKQVNPNEYQAKMHELRDTLVTISKEGWGKDPQTQERRKSNFANWLTAFGNQVAAGKPDLVREWLNITSSPNIIGRITELPKQTQDSVVAPIMEKTRQLLESPDVPEMGLFYRLHAIQQDQANQILNPTTFRVVVNPTTQLFEIQVKSKAKVGKAVDISGGGAGSIIQTGDKWTTGTGQLDVGGLRTVVDNINKAVQTLKNLQDIGYGADEKAIKEGFSTNLLNKYNAGYFNIGGQERNKALEKAAPKGPVKASDLLGERS